MNLLPKFQRQNRRALRLAGVGVDIVSLARIRRLMKHYGLKVPKRLLSASEKAVLSSPLSVRGMARRFAAKEAYFKSLGESWLGVEGFRKIHVDCGTRGNFRAHRVAFQKPRTEAQGRFFEGKQWVVARVIRWE